MEIRGSAHSACKVLMDDEIRSSLKVMNRRNVLSVYIDDKTVLKFDPRGIDKGWCNWPINFDPIWVDCYLNVPQKEKEDGE